jgi:hypothetical protein
MGLPSVDMSERRGCSRDESTGKCEVWRAVLSSCVGMAPAAHQSQLSRSNSNLAPFADGVNGSRRQRISVARPAAAARPARASRTLAAVRLISQADRNHWHPARPLTQWRSRVLAKHYHRWRAACALSRPTCWAPRLRRPSPSRPRSRCSATRAGRTSPHVSQHPASRSQRHPALHTP